MGYKTYDIVSSSITLQVVKIIQSLDKKI